MKKPSIKQPSIKQVTEHFKYADIVEFVNSNTQAKLTTKIFKNNDCRGINEFDASGEYLKTNNTYHCVWGEGRGYAKIISTIN